MKKVLFLYCAFIGIATLNAQNALKFNENKKLKIVQFTDIHNNPTDPKSRPAFEVICEVLDVEKPDFVMFTGDIVWGKPAEKALRDVLQLVSERKIPFGLTFGNHDDEQDLTRKQLLGIAQSFPCNMTSTTPDITGVTNYVLPVYPSVSDSQPAFLLYSFDSNAYSTIPDVKGYDYIHSDQITWYRNQSAAFTQQNGGKPIPAIAFFHIPLPEFAQAAANENAILTGTRKEKACPAEINSGLFVAIKEMGDIMATFVGHDHDNDYAVYWQGILLAYGRYTGGNTVYNNLKPNGARVIELTEGKNGFRTWIRLRGGNIIHDIYYPDFFLTDK